MSERLHCPACGIPTIEGGPDTTEDDLYCNRCAETLEESAMSTQHTPGPWQVHDVGQVLLQDQIGMLEQGLDSHDEWVSVGEYDNEGALSVVALCHPANAHLIAAAPNLRNELEDSDALLAELSQYVASEFVERIAEQRKRNLDTLDRAEGVTQ